MSYYLQGKQFFTAIAKQHGNTQVLDEYKLIKDKSGEFIGALFIKQVYEDYLDNTQKRKKEQ